MQFAGKNLSVIICNSEKKEEKLTMKFAKEKIKWNSENESNEILKMTTKENVKNCKIREYFVYCFNPLGNLQIVAFFFSWKFLEFFLYDKI